MIRLLADEDVPKALFEGTRLRDPTLVFERVQDVGLRTQPDEEILEWAAVHDLIVVTRDKATMPDAAFARLDRGDFMAGVFVVPRGHPVGRMIDDLVLIHACSDQAEWHGKVVRLPV